MVRIVPCISGWRAMPWIALGDHEADTDARADGGRAVDDTGADGLQTGLELTGLLGGEEQCGHDGFSPVCEGVRQ